MENLKKNLSVDKYIFKCSQCNQSLDISDQNFFCKNCKTNYCPSCIKGHNEVFIDHEVIKASEELLIMNDSSKNSLMANPDLDLDDRLFIESKHLHSNNAENEEYYSDITMLFRETLTSIEEQFNDEICKLKVEKTKAKEKEGNENKIIIENNSEGFNIEELKKMEPIERLKKIMDIINKK